MSSLRDHPLLASAFLVRIGHSLILLFIVNSLFGLLPLKLLDPAWQLRVADLLRTTAPFALLGVALIYLSELVGGGTLSWLPLRRIQTLAPLAALGFLLLIPLQIQASWQQIHTADGEAQKTIRAVERRIAAVRSVANSAALAELSKGLPPYWQPLPEASLSVNRSRLLGRVEPELARLSTLASTNKSATIQKRLQDGLRDALLSVIYAVAFYGLRPVRFGAVSLNKAGVDAGEEAVASALSPTGWSAKPDRTPASSPGANPRADASAEDRAHPDEPDLSQADRHPWYP